MPPRNVDQMPLTALDDELPETIDEQSPTLQATVVKRPPMQIVWRNVIWFFFLHCFALYGLYLLPYAKPATWLWGKTSCNEYSSGSLNTEWHSKNKPQRFFTHNCIS